MEEKKTKERQKWVNSKERFFKKEEKERNRMKGDKDWRKFLIVSFILMAYPPL